MAGIHQYTVYADEITAIYRAGSLRIEHTAEDVPSPVRLVLPGGHPVRTHIEGLRPDLVIDKGPRQCWWTWLTAVLKRR